MSFHTLRYSQWHSLAAGAIGAGLWITDNSASIEKTFPQIHWLAPVLGIAAYGVTMASRSLNKGKSGTGTGLFGTPASAGTVEASPVVGEVLTEAEALIVQAMRAAQAKEEADAAATRLNTAKAAASTIQGVNKTVLELPSADALATSHNEIAASMAETMGMRNAAHGVAMDAAGDAGAPLLPSPPFTTKIGPATEPLYPAGEGL